MPTLKQVQNFVSILRKSNGGSSLTMEELVQYCKSHEKDPENENLAAIFAYEISSPNQFVVIWTTDKLLQKQKLSPQIQVK